MVRRLLACALFLSVQFVIASTPVQADSGQGAVEYSVYLPLLTREATAAMALPAEPGFPSLLDFTATVAGGPADTVTGVYVSEVLALPVIQQPADNYGYVSEQVGVVTQFRLAASYGVTGLLAHNFASGALFFELAPGQRVHVILGDGSAKEYQVSEILRYQALQPFSTASDFVDLATGEQLTAGQVFARAYMGGDQVTFQTCIASGGIGSWGRLFVIATPVE